MLRRTLLATLIAFSSLAMPFASASIINPTDNRPVPWPWSLAQPFPWSDIQGTWKIEQDGESVYFIFKVVKQKNGVRQLQVKQIDGGSCKVVATGAGVERNQRVLAQVTDKRGHTYRVNLTAFKASDVARQIKGSIYRDSIMVLSIGDLDHGRNDEMVHTQITKINEELDLKACTAELKN